jgi:hypothetical protein
MFKLVKNAVLGRNQLTQVPRNVVQRKFLACSAFKEWWPFGGVYGYGMGRR